MEFVNNEVSVCDDLAGVNIVKGHDDNYISIEFSHDPEIQLYLTTADLDYFLNRCAEIKKEREEN